jgi:solute carrier family 25 thiamine pyrophosphate transporter 19
MSSQKKNSVFAGSVAGIVARTVVCPLDVLKIRLQVPEGRSFRLLDEVRRLPLASLWRGNVAGVILYAAYNGTQFGIYSSLPTDDVFFKASTAALTATLLTYPFDVLRTRMTLNRQPIGLATCISTIWRTEGPSAFYKGSLLTVSQVVPYMGSIFTLHSWFNRFTNDFLAGALSGFLCKTAFMPVDVVRKRLQLLQLNQEAFAVRALSPARNLRELCVRMWLVEGGMRPFFRGWTMAVTKAAPTTGITFFVYGQMMKILSK